MILRFNDGWEFSLTALGGKLSDCEKWEAVTIPHDWLIYDTENLYKSGTGFYRRTFSVNNKADHVYKLYFEGVYMDCTVYVNGEAAGEWKYGYSSFEVDITEQLNEGDNDIVVEVRHNAPNSRWYSGAGIYRNIIYKILPSTYIRTDSLYFAAKQTENGWSACVDVAVENDYAETEINYELRDAQGNVVFEKKLGGSERHSCTIELPSVNVWSLSSPYLYSIKAELYGNGVILDSVTNRVGFRTIEFRPDSGFFLNGEHVKLHGVCNHHDLGCLGAAVSRDAIERQLTIMKEMGVNAIRTSHNMPAVELMELCDRMGILVDSEAFDIWELKKNEYDYARFFNDWVEHDVESWVCRDRNHPSLIMWSIGNEIYDTHASERGVEITKLLCENVRRHDYRHNAYTTIGSNYIPWEGAQKCAAEVEVSGYNYCEYIYDEHHEKYPDWCIYGSETASRVYSRGVYHFPLKTAYLTHDDIQCSALGNCRSGNSDRTVSDNIVWDRDSEFCAGQFIWTGFDYIGEPTPYFTKNSYFGQVDTAGFRKDAFYIYQSAWTDKPVLHLLPYWDFNEGQLIDVVAYSNQKSVELFFNGTSLGKKEPSGYQTAWQLPYAKGTLEAVACDENDDVTARDSRSSFGNAARLSLKADRATVKANCTDLIFVEITALDEDGNAVENANCRVNVKVGGAGCLVGLDNGDSTDYDQYKCTSRKLFGGKLLAVIRSTDKCGEITLSVSSPSIIGAEATFSVLSCELPAGVSLLPETLPYIEREDIPVRKLSLHVDGGTRLTKENSSVKVTAEVLPQNATYSDIKWSCVTNSGIECAVATVEADGVTATVTAKGDGEFRLRCCCFNGKKWCEVVSELEFSVSGLGEVTIDPYKLTPASLYSAALCMHDEVTEGGINITLGREAVGFRNVDFGRAGSDTLIIPIIYWHRNDPIKFSLWRGMYWEKGAEKLGDFVYQADFVWQTYIENTFKLDKRLTGVQNLSFKFEAKGGDRISLGGFRFEPIERAYDKIKACDNDCIYGDSFERSGEEIHSIGNNVFIQFNDLLFKNGVSSLTICGKTNHDKDTVHFVINGKQGIVRGIAEFKGTDTELEIPITAAIDRETPQEVRLEFLPGCDFDLSWIQFKA